MKQYFLNPVSRCLRNYTVIVWGTGPDKLFAAEQEESDGRWPLRECLFQKINLLMAIALLRVLWLLLVYKGGEKQQQGQQQQAVLKNTFTVPVRRGRGAVEVYYSLLWQVLRAPKKLLVGLVHIIKLPLPLLPSSWTVGRHFSIASDVLGPKKSFLKADNFVNLVFTEGNTCICWRRRTGCSRLWRKLIGIEL